MVRGARREARLPRATLDLFSPIPPGSRSRPPVYHILYHSWYWASTCPHWIAFASLLRAFWFKCSAAGGGASLRLRDGLWLRVRQPIMIRTWLRVAGGAQACGTVDHSLRLRACPRLRALTGSQSGWPWQTPSPSHWQHTDW